MMEEDLENKQHIHRAWIKPLLTEIISLIKSNATVTHTSEELTEGS